MATVADVAGLAGDFNQNGLVDAADYAVWRDGLGSTYTHADYDVWRAHFGQTGGNGATLHSPEPSPAAVPEPASLAVAVIAFMAASSRRVHIAGLSIR